MTRKVLLYTLCLIFVSSVYGQDVDKKYTREINSMGKNKKIQSAFDKIEEWDAWSTEILIELTEIPAPPFMEEKRAVAFAAMLEKAGADSVWIDQEGNVLALKKGSGGEKTVALDAHIDTVFPIETDVTVKMRGDTLFAPGIGDDTRGLAMVITILRAISESQIKTSSDMLFIGTVGEEGLGDLRGVRYLFEGSPVKIDSWISIDGGSIGRINHMGLGSVRYKATIDGPGGHSWGAFGLPNPHHAMSLAISEFNERALKYTSEGEKTSFNVGRVGGGTSINSIPFQSWVEVDMRSVSPDRLKEIETIFKESMQSGLDRYNSMIKEGPDLTMDLKNIGNRPSGELPLTLPLIQRAMAVNSFFEIPPRLTRGSTNSNIPISKGIPAITIGRGGKGRGAHSLGEWWLNDNGAQSIKLAMMILLAESGLEK